MSIGTSIDRDNSGAIALLKIDGKNPRDVGRELEHKFRIHTTSITWEGIAGVRITPNVYTLMEDLDRLIKAVQSII